MRLIKAIFYVILSISISGCISHSVKEDPILNIPKPFISPIPKMPNYINSNKEIYEYCLHSIDDANLKSKMIIKYQKQFNDHTS